MDGQYCVEKCKGCIFICGVSGKLWVLTGALLRFLNIMQNTCIFHWTRIKRISSTRQFDHDCAKKQIQKGSQVHGYYVVLIGNSRAKTQFCIKLLL